MQLQKIYFFFNDVKNCNYADPNFIRKVLTSLDCSIYFSGQQIIKPGQVVENLYFISKNSVLLMDPRGLFILR